MTRAVAWRRTAPILAFSMIVATLGLAAAEEATAAPRVESQVKWSTCYRDVAAEFSDLGVHYECTQINVPLDYDDPKGGAISLALVRIPAVDQASRIGSLFLNPGGPGGSGVDFALFFGPFAQFIWGPIANRYDIVGVDPRGIMRSTPLRCFGTLDQAVEAFPPLPFPEAADQLPLFEAADEFLDDQCSTRGNKVVDHMSTANVARDLDLLRARLGDEHLNFVGLSYGSMVGQTYANMFPDRVGAMVIDGVLDPIAWANLDGEIPFSTLLRSDEGALETLHEFVRQCDAAAAGNCALAPDAGETIDAVLERLQVSPAVVIDPFTGEEFLLTYSIAVGFLLGALYNPFGYPEAAAAFDAIASQLGAEALGDALRDMESATGLVNKRGFPNYPNFVEGFPAVACEDTTFVDGGHELWFDAGRQATDEFGLFGEIWTWASGPCTVWSNVDTDAYRGPWDTETANPILVIGNLYDPATRYEGAVTADSLLPNSALITVDEPGHTSLGLSGCAGFLTGVYLENPAAAPILDGAVCESGGNWFDLLSGAAPGAADSGMSFRTRLMEDIAFRP